MKFVPAVTFDPDVLRRVVALGAHIDVDIYCLPTRGPGDSPTP